jgi:phage recombination protein Bet
VPGKDDCIRFIMLCKSRHLNPFEGDAYFLGYDGREGTTWSLITAHQAFLKRAEAHPDFDGMESGVLVFKKGKPNDLIQREGDFLFDDDILVGGWATVHFKNRTYPIKRRVNLKTFRKPFGRWNDDPAGMICKCAEADALRSSFPSMLGGCYTEEEMPAPADAKPGTGGRKIGKAASAVPDQEPEVEVEPEQPPTLQELVARGEQQAAQELDIDALDAVATTYTQDEIDATAVAQEREILYLAGIAEQAGCKPEDTCLEFAEQAHEQCNNREEAEAWLKTKPWSKPAGKKQTKTQQSMIPESEIPF